MYYASQITVFTIKDILSCQKIGNCSEQNDTNNVFKYTLSYTPSAQNTIHAYILTYTHINKYIHKYLPVRRIVCRTVASALYPQCSVCPRPAGRSFSLPSHSDERAAESLYRMMIVVVDISALLVSVFYK